ncbi:MAG: hypothetical protein ABSB32_15800 [Thermodesulfobacteriota bacterium]|jgi:hypothetical protein
MAEDQKNTRKEFKSFCEGIPFADMMRKMMDAKKSGSPFNCAEMISQMMQMCCGGREKKEEPAPATKENPVPNQ